jgi:hypothetical protein
MRVMPACRSSANIRNVPYEQVTVFKSNASDQEIEAARLSKLFAASAIRIASPLAPMNGHATPGSTLAVPADKPPPSLKVGQRPRPSHAGRERLDLVKDRQVAVVKKSPRRLITLVRSMGERGSGQHMQPWKTAPLRRRWCPSLPVMNPISNSYLKMMTPLADAGLRH